MVLTPVAELILHTSTAAVMRDDLGRLIPEQERGEKSREPISRINLSSLVSLQAPHSTPPRAMILYLLVDEAYLGRERKAPVWLRRWLSEQERRKIWNQHYGQIRLPSLEDCNKNLDRSKGRIVDSKTKCDYKVHTEVVLTASQPTALHNCKRKNQYRGSLPSLLIKDIQDARTEASCPLAIYHYFLKMKSSPWGLDADNPIARESCPPMVNTSRKHLKDTTKSKKAGADVGKQLDDSCQKFLRLFSDSQKQKKSTNPQKVQLISYGILPDDTGQGNGRFNLPNLRVKKY
ncbi:uncharacterized protein BDR25DRAFT_360986 [Lindgomyces ingoldianus]|uniref:Uncharacterized protein n=1 Tax=Lindgomyces ingoldianus TaxID=673940 RepID=A0ACB6QF15_9PLEO|nr:uncharacterized protein BDR25DRAFT_360986 [Lindgomyces ingoldianus]KAF2465085.1 hypothetical protein BDR25DRAFT_360986 [Lindgomyces ingoldianus]